MDASIMLGDGEMRVCFEYDSARHFHAICDDEYNFVAPTDVIQENGDYRTELVNHIGGPG